MIVPDAIEPIVGWRYWSLNDDGRLESPFQPDSPWLPRERKEARCGIGDLPSMFKANFTLGERAEPKHPAPHENCMCGIHAAKDLGTLRFLSMPEQVVGEVSLWGKVIPGEYGYRAQFAYPKSLYLVSEHALEAELARLRPYCADVGVMAPIEAAWGWEEAGLNIPSLNGLVQKPRQKWLSPYVSPFQMNARLVLIATSLAVLAQQAIDGLGESLP